MDESFVVRTDLFEHRKVKPHFINPCCFGEDFAGWLREQILAVPGSRFVLSDVIQEDYGWGFWASHAGDPFWIAVSYIGDGPQEEPADWGISVAYEPGLNVIKRLFHKPNVAAMTELKEHVRRILSSDPGITPIEL